VAVSLPFADNGAGLPSELALEALHAFEDGTLEPALHGDGELLAVETTGGQRTLHYYVDGASSAGDDLTAAAAGWAGGRAKVKRAHDPGLEAVAHLS
jgi:hypothetical protein